eukprot:m.587946 g.587946  ORF g.587946 m.587946 type:complete len:321 (+) comp22359_c1_seq8:213-1175(+)
MTVHLQAIPCIFATMTLFGLILHGQASPAKSFAHTTVDKVDPYTMDLHLMHDFAASDGAVCLDGSPGAFYFRPATDPTHQNDWLFHFKGAGWCYDEQDCFGRSNMQFGSSTTWANTTGGWNGGILGPGDTVFGAFNKVVFLYCDGASFTGNRTDPVIVNGKPLYFRGLRIRNAILATLVRDHGLGSARDVLLTGCSSGGLAAYMHSDNMRDTMQQLAPKTLRKFRTAPCSGFFLYHDNVVGVPVYQEQMKNIFELSNSSGAFDHAPCGAVYSGMSAAPVAQGLCTRFQAYVFLLEFVSFKFASVFGSFPLEFGMFLPFFV